MLLKKMRTKILILFLGLFVSLLLLEGALQLTGTVAKMMYDPEIHLKKSGYTIMTVGNSYTYGLGAPPGQSYSDQLNDLLKKRENKNYNVINRGKTNANTALVKERLDGWLTSDRPDLVFLMVGEPNQWNRYGYWKFLKEIKTEKKGKDFKESLEIFRWSATYRLYELLINKNENREGLSRSGYSVVFQTTPLDLEHRWLLGYQWLGGIQNGSLIVLGKMSSAEVDEAISALKYIEEKDKNPIAAIYLAELILSHKKDPKQAMDYIERSISYSERFDYNQWCILGVFKDYLFAAEPVRYQAAIETLERKIDPDFFKILTEKMYEYKLHTYEALGENFLYQASKYIPVHTDIPRLYAQKNLLTHPEKAFEMIERTLSVNPFSYNSNLLESARRISELNPALADRYENLVRNIEMKAGGIDIRSMVQTTNLDHQWIVHDLEAMIKKIKASGAKVIVQTYPPYRKGTPRFADLILRDWWKNYREKDGVDFMDVGAQLDSLFAQKNGGERFYSTILGPTDDHPNAEGYGHIARLMEPLIP